MSIRILDGKLTVEIRFNNATLLLDYIVISENFYQNIELDKAILKLKNKRYLIDDDYAEEILEKVMDETGAHSKFELSKKSPIKINKKLDIDTNKVFGI